MQDLSVLRLEERVEIGIDAGESHFREFKSAVVRDGAGGATLRPVKDLCRDIAEALVSFANADGGELYVGVEDDGTVSGVGHPDEQLRTLKDAPRTHVHSDTPLPAPIVGDVAIDAQRVIYFSVPKSLDRVHLTADGRCLRRADRENRPIAAERIQADRQELASRECDRCFVDGATIGDLDLELVNAASQQLAPGYSPEKVLQYLQLAEYAPGGLRIRMAALLLFAREVGRWHPRCQVRIARVKGTDLGVGQAYNVTQDDIVTGPVLRLLEEAWQNLRPHLARTRLISSGVFRESLIYPEAACREALVNAIAHRDYSRQGSAIEVFVFDDRMEFRSPGGLLSSISIERLASLQGVHESRNAHIARTLREVGYMREMGEGISRIYRSMRDSELVDPDLASEADRFTVTLRHKSIFTQHDIEWLEGYKEFDLTKNEQRVVLLGRDGHLLSTNEIIDVAGIVDIDDFRALYEGLRRKGVVYNAKPRVGGSAQKRRVGRFQVRPPREVEQFFGEMLSALRLVATAVGALSPAMTRDLRLRLSPKSPYSEHPDVSLQALGLVDAQRRLLPKAFSFVPELETGQPVRQTMAAGTIKVVRATYGFVAGDDGEEYFFHQSSIAAPLSLSELKRDARVTFRITASRTPGERDAATEIRRADK